MCVFEHCTWYVPTQSIYGLYTRCTSCIYTCYVVWCVLLGDAWVCFGFAWSFLGHCVGVAFAFLLYCVVRHLLFLGTSRGPHREAVWVGLQGAGERAAGACEPLVYVGHRVARFFRSAAGACSHGGGLRESLGWWAGLCAVLAAGAGMAQARNADRSCDTLCSRPARSAARAPRFICAHVLLA